MRMNNISFSTYGRLEMKNRTASTANIGENILYHINEGEFCGEADGKEMQFKKGHLYLIPQTVTLNYTAEYADHTFVNFYCTPGIALETILEVKVDEFPLLKTVFDSLNDLVVRYPMWEMGQEFVYHEIITSTFTNLMALLNQEFEIFAVKDEIINKVIEYIHNHYNEKLSVNDLAVKYHIDKSSFIRRFKRYTNITPYQYIKSLRINKAVELIKSGKYTLSQVAEMVGYSDAASLSHSISKLTFNQQ